MIQYPHVRRFLLALEFAMQGMFVKLECSRVIFVTSLWKMHIIVCSGMFLKNLSATMHMTSFSEVKSWISPAFFTAEQFCIFEKILFQQNVSRYARVQYTKKKRELLNQLNFPPCSWLWCEREIRIQNCLKHFISEARENQISCSACVPRRIWNLKQKKDKNVLKFSWIISCARSCEMGKVCEISVIVWALRFHEKPFSAIYEWFHTAPQACSWRAA